jgi:hypothetical protein
MLLLLVAELTRRHLPVSMLLLLLPLRQLLIGIYQPAPWTHHALLQCLLLQQDVLLLHKQLLLHWKLLHCMLLLQIGLQCLVETVTSACRPHAT